MLVDPAALIERIGWRLVGGDSAETCRAAACATCVAAAQRMLGAARSARDNHH